MQRKILILCIILTTNIKPWNSENANHWDKMTTTHRDASIGFTEGDYVFFWIQFGFFAHNRGKLQKRAIYSLTFWKKKDYQKSHNTSKTSF